MRMWALMNFSKATCEPAGKAKKFSSVRLISHNNIQANKVAIVSSVITKIFNPRKHWTVTIPLLLNDTLLISACIICCLFLLFDVSSIQYFFDSMLLFDLILFFSIQIIQCIFCPDPGNVFRVF